MMKLGVVFHCRAERRSAQAERGSALHYKLFQFQIIFEDVEQLIRVAGAQPALPDLAGAGPGAAHVGRDRPKRTSCLLTIGT